MNLSAKPLNKTKSIGIFLELCSTSNAYASAYGEWSGLHRVSIQLLLPETRRDRWLELLTNQILDCANGRNMSVHMEWDNVSQFFAMNELEKLDHILTGISFYYHGCPDALIQCKNVNVEQLYRKKYNNGKRLRYAAALLSAEQEGKVHV